LDRQVQSAGEVAGIQADYRLVQKDEAVAAVAGDGVMKNPACGVGLGWRRAMRAVAHGLVHRHGGHGTAFIVVVRRKHWMLPMCRKSNMSWRCIACSPWQLHSATMDTSLGRW
jgi:hypothetical protein